MRWELCLPRQRLLGSCVLADGWPGAWHLEACFAADTALRTPEGPRHPCCWHRLYTRLKTTSPLPPLGTDSCNASKGRSSIKKNLWSPAGTLVSPARECS